MIISADQAGGRLDIFLAEVISDWSRSQLAKNIKAGIVLVNGKEAKPHYKLKIDDEIVIGDLTVAEPLLRHRAIIDLTSQVEVVAETAEYLVVNKPAGMIVHYPVDKPGVEVVDRNPSLVDWLLARHPEVVKVGDDPSRPGIVHRLDKAVSGLLVIALTQDSFDNLKRQFKERLTEKHYNALVYGHIIKDNDVLNFPLMRSANGKKMAAMPLGSELGKTAITEFTVEKSMVNYTLLDVNLKTGRTHQIRAHMAAYGHPIVGDMIYSTANTRRLNRKLNLGRLFLTAVSLAFTDLQGERQEFHIDLPAALEPVLKKAK
jgi:23S rRNA pseudouridine1911/1915/1917 synthase